MPDTPPLIWTDAQLHPEAFELLRHQVRLCGPTLNPPGASPGGFADAHGAIVGPRIIYDGAMLARAPRLKIIARTGIGCDNIDLAAAASAGVCVVNTPDAPTESTAEFAVGLMFAVARRIPAADHHSKAGRWKIDPDVMGFDLADKSLGLVGFGRIARRVAEMARAIRMQVSAFDPFVAAPIMAEAGVTPCSDLPELLQGTQVLSLHAPLDPGTRRLIGAEQLALLPAGAILINT
ncbi:MAG: NAD(P)-dependent oxidoreductase, partial [Opitutaceae bacterium]